MSIENIVGMMFEYFRAIPERIIRPETITMSVKVVDIDIVGYVRRSINKEWGICTRWEVGIIKGRCRSRSSSDRCYRCDKKT
ncbi:hypothetical protein AGMMS49990_02480 [Endomicrobiia bacterium]|nr:hypothetical protein AGMMS49990_02480 [Endomicrobiia bacterium]